jgi:hypothetical protein
VREYILAKPPAKKNVQCFRGSLQVEENGTCSVGLFKEI